MVSPGAGLAMAVRCAVVILGGRKPLLADFTSHIADASGMLPSLFTLTWEIS
jgi:hypothetical protein